jgi:hypothetical protein
MIAGRCFFIIVVCITGVSSLFAYDEWNIPNLMAPTTVKPFGLEVRFQHQFTGRIDGKDNVARFFGLGDGADGCITVRAVVWNGAQVYASYDNMQLFNLSHNEFGVGTSYALAIPWIFLKLQADAQYFSYGSFKTYPEQRINNFFVQGSLQNDPLFGRVSAIVDVGFDFDKSAPGLGLGLIVKVIDILDVYGEFFPVLKKSDDPLFPDRTTQNPFSGGVKITTYGHQFCLNIGNATEIGPRHLMSGASDNNLKLGFEIKRLFSFPYPWF